MRYRIEVIEDVEDPEKFAPPNTVVAWVRFSVNTATVEDELMKGGIIRRSPIYARAPRGTWDTLDTRCKQFSKHPFDKVWELFQAAKVKDFANNWKILGETPNVGWHLKYGGQTTSATTK